MYLRGTGVHLPEVVEVVQGLQEGVHVASGALVLQAHMPRFLFGVVEAALKTVEAEHDLHDDCVVDEKAFGR